MQQWRISMRNTLTSRLAILLAAASFTTLGACDAISGLTGGGDEAAAPAAAGAGAGAGGGAAAAPAAPAFDSNVAQLGDPQVGDVWAANLDHFSAIEFGEPGGADVFGLVQVVDVNDTQVTIITATSSAPNQSGAISQLNDQSSVQWDPQERIPVNRTDFANLVRDQRILRTMRGAAPAAGGGSGDYSAGGGAAAPAAPAAPAPAAPGGGK
jgi:hypothetical protein